MELTTRSKDSNTYCACFPGLARQCFGVQVCLIEKSSQATVRYLSLACKTSMKQQTISCLQVCLIATIHEMNGRSYTTVLVLTDAAYSFSLQGEDLGPYEMKIEGLQKQISDSLEQCAQMQQFWLRQQNELVRKTRSMDDQASAIDSLKKQLLILNQKKLRTDGTVLWTDRELVFIHMIVYNVHTCSNQQAYPYSIKLEIFSNSLPESGSEKGSKY